MCVKFPPSQHFLPTPHPSLDEKLFDSLVRLQRPPQTSTVITTAAAAAVMAGPVSQAILQEENASSLTVGLLESGTGTWTAELLGLAAAVVGNEEGTVELGEGLLQQVLGVLIDEPIGVLWLVIDFFFLRFLFVRVSYFMSRGWRGSYFWL